LWTTLLTLGVVLARFFAYLKLPVAPLSQIDFPTITVCAAMPGASPVAGYWRRDRNFSAGSSSPSPAAVVLNAAPSAAQGPKFVDLYGTFPVKEFVFGFCRFFVRRCV
jgi:hypothetical protein